MMNGLYLANFHPLGVQNPGINFNHFIFSKFLTCNDNKKAPGGETFQRLHIGNFRRSVFNRNVITIWKEYCFANMESEMAYYDVKKNWVNFFINNYLINYNRHIMEILKLNWDSVSNRRSFLTLLKILCFLVLQ